MFAGKWVQAFTKTVEHPKMKTRARSFGPRSYPLLKQDSCRRLRCNRRSSVGVAGPICSCCIDCSSLPMIQLRRAGTALNDCVQSKNLTAIDMGPCRLSKMPVRLNHRSPDPPVIADVAAEASFPMAQILSSLGSGDPLRCM